MATPLNFVLEQVWTLFKSTWPTKISTKCPTARYCSECFSLLWSVLSFLPTLELLRLNPRETLSLAWLALGEMCSGGLLSGGSVLSCVEHLHMFFQVYDIYLLQRASGVSQHCSHSALLKVSLILFCNNLSRTLGQRERKRWSTWGSGSSDVSRVLWLL